jgi:hypothetical protein
MTSPTSIFPDDKNGDALGRMQSNGDDLTKARNIDFTVVFPNESKALAFSDHFQALGYKTVIENTGCAKDLPWDVVVVKQMLPTHEGITSFEEQLEIFAGTLGGRNDGWGCLTQTER